MEYCNICHGWFWIFATGSSQGLKFIFHWWDATKGEAGDIFIPVYADHCSWWNPRYELGAWVRFPKVETWVLQTYVKVSKRWRSSSSHHGAEDKMMDTELHHRKLDSSIVRMSTVIMLMILNADLLLRNHFAVHGKQYVWMDIAQSARSIRAFSASSASACGAHSKPVLFTVRCLQASAYFGAHFHLAVHDKQCVAAVWCMLSARFQSV